MLHLSRFLDKGNAYHFCPSGGVADQTLLQIANQFRSNTSKKYKTLPARLIEQTFQKDDRVLATVKYDGEGQFVFFDAEADLCFCFCAPSGRARIGLPCLEDTKSMLKEKGVKKALLAAELYLQTDPNQRSRCSDVNHVGANGTPEEIARLGLAFYNVIMLDGKDQREDPIPTIWATLGSLFPETGRAHRAEGEFLTGADIPGFFKTTTAEKGLEGIVLTTCEGSQTYKCKPNLTLDTVVIGYVEGEFEERYGVLSLLCALTAPDGKTLQTICRVGSGLSDSLREELLPRLQSLRVENPLTMTDSEGRPILFVKPNLVVEVEGEAIIETQLDGTPISSQTFKREETGELTFKGINPSPRLSHAVFARTREDKDPLDPEDTRASQALGETAIQAILNPPQAITSEAKVILRETAKKLTKEKLSVRKILVAERNHPNFHRFTIHWTDYSPERKESLKTETLVADTPSRLEEILTSLREETKKRGWMPA